MDSSLKKPNPISPGYAIMAAFIGAAIAVTIYAWAQGSAPAPAIVETCDTDPAIAQSLDDLKADSGLFREEMNSVRLEVADLRDQVKTLGGDTAGDLDLRSTLPPPYVAEVDAFFSTPSARNLLDPKIQKAPDLMYGRVRFVTPRTITVPYTTGGKTRYLMIEITILEYYHLQFDVTWDSIEGE